MLIRVLAGLCAGACAATVGAAAAAADPAPDPAPPDPALIGPALDAAAPPPPLDPFAAASAQSKADPGGTLTALLGGSSPTEMLSQGFGLTAPPPVDPLATTNQLMPQYYRMPSGEEASPYVLQSDVPAGPFARVDAFKGVHALAHGALGRMPGAELGQPLPGTAPPAGTNLPPGLEQFYVEPLPPAG